MKVSFSRIKKGQIIQPNIRCIPIPNTLIILKMCESLPHNKNEMDPGVHPGASVGD
jgi:hypothetical protein